MRGNLPASLWLSEVGLITSMFSITTNTIIRSERTISTVIHCVGGLDGFSLKQEELCAEDLFYAQLLLLLNQRIAGLQCYLF